MRINDEFEADEVRVIRLYRNGKPVVDERGEPKNYASWDDACHVAANWEDFRAPTYAEIQAMSDDELTQRAFRPNR